MNPRVVMLMRLHGHMMAIILAESGKHHVTTPTLHMIMTVVVGQHQDLTTGRGVEKIALTGVNLTGLHVRDIIMNSVKLTDLLYNMNDQLPRLVPYTHLHCSLTCLYSGSLCMDMLSVASSIYLHSCTVVH